jgi:DNA-binding NtrC family response regulator
MLALNPGRSQIDVADLPAEVQHTTDGPGFTLRPLPERGVDLDAEMRDVERTLLRQALDRTKGNRRQAADLLRIKRTTLVEKLKRFGLD